MTVNCRNYLKQLNLYFKYLLLFIIINGCSKETPIIPATVPGSPTNLVAIAGNGSATISFSEPSSNGGSNISSYIVTSTPGNITASGIKSPITVTGLTNGISYTFSVTAINSAGPSIPSALSPAIIPGMTIVSAKNCQIISVTNKNSNNKSDIALTVYYDFVNRASRFVLFDSIRNIKLKENTFTYQSDGIAINKFESISLDPTTQQVRKFTTKADLSNPNSDELLYEYVYNDSGYLITKNQYINGAKTPTYKTTYSYDASNNLVSCLMQLVSGNKKILESTATYDETRVLSNFIYTFPDGFENYIYTTIFNYGKKPKYAIKSMVTKIIDPSTGGVLDTWTTAFGTYSINPDGYITQLTQTGDFQQGLGLFYGKTDISYICK